jgi:hypothetical protein
MPSMATARDMLGVKHMAERLGSPTTEECVNTRLNPSRPSAFSGLDATTAKPNIVGRSWTSRRSAFRKLMVPAAAHEPWN